MCVHEFLFKWQSIIFKGVREGFRKEGFQPLKTEERDEEKRHYTHTHTCTHTHTQGKKKRIRRKRIKLWWMKLTWYVYMTLRSSPSALERMLGNTRK